MRFIEILENKLGLDSEKEFLKMQKGDVVETWAKVDSLKKWIDYSPNTPIEQGVENFLKWYKEYYLIK